MKKSLSIFIFALFFHSFLYANPQQDLQQALAQLTLRLERLQSSLNKRLSPKKAEEYFGSEELPIPPEIREYILEKIIPTSLSSGGVATFKNILENLNKVSQISKAYNEALQNSHFKKIIVQKLFGIITPRELSSMKLPKTLSNSKTVLGTINNILYYYKLLRYPSASAQVIDGAIRYIVDAGIDPNTLMHGQDILLNIAILYATPNTVKYLVQKGANVNLSDYLSDNYVPFPFSRALYYSPASALILLESPSIDIATILANLSKYKIQVTTPTLKFLHDGKMYTQIFNVLLDKGMSPNATILWDIEETPSVTVFNTIAALYPQALSLIEKMLKNGADPSKTFFNGWQSITALEYAQDKMNDTDTPEKDRAAYKKLYELLQKYKKTA